MTDDDAFMSNPLGEVSNKYLYNNERIKFYVNFHLSFIFSVIFFRRWDIVT